MDEPLLVELEQTLHREMPICAAMKMAVVSWDDPNADDPASDGGRLAMSMPLAPNRNLMSTAFAGSLNALCTIVGWGTMFLLLRRRGLDCKIVIRRGTIRYLRPVTSAEIIAQALPIDPDEIDYFFELLQSKSTSKLDVAVVIADEAGPLVTFRGSYVVQGVSAKP